MITQKNKIRDYFDRKSNREKTSFSFKSQASILRATIIRYIQEPQNISTYLDIASGSGNVIHLITDYLLTSEYYLLDLSKSVLVESNFKKKIQGDGTKLPFLSNTFDLITCRQGLHYMDISLAIGEILRVLRPGGILIISNEWWLFGDETREEIKYIHNYAKTKNKPPHILLSREEIVRYLKDFNFEIIHRSYYYDTYFMDIDEWLSFYDSDEDREKNKRLSFIDCPPNTSTKRGYPRVINDQITYTSKWTIVVGLKQ